MKHPAEQSVITQVEKHKRNKHRYNIYINEEFAFSVHEDVLIKYRLLKGESFDPDQLEAILAEDEKNRAYLDAIRFIGHRPRSVKEVQDKLKQRGYESALIADIVAMLKDHNYLNDEQFAAMWTEQRITLNAKGKKWVKMELAQKGVGKNEINKAIGQVDEADELRFALGLAEKRWPLVKGELPERKGKLYAFLMRRGYSTSVIQQTIKQMTGDSMESFD